VSQPVSDDIGRYLVRDLTGMKTELEAYERESHIWERPEPFPNPAGNLALHVCGNIRYFLGTVMCGGDYVRDRPREFAATGLTRAELLDTIDATIADVRRFVPTLDERVLGEPFGFAFQDRVISNREMLLQMAVHLTYHLGQVNYHRRIVTGDRSGTRAVMPMALPETL